MNDYNLIDISTRDPRERKMIASKGGRRSVESRRKKKEEKAQRESLAEILKEVLYSPIKPQDLNDMMKNLGIESGNNYFAALSASVLLEGIKKGDINALCKIMELLDENCHSGGNENESFNNLIGAIKYARETKRKAK